MKSKPQIEWSDFEKVDIRVGTITAVDPFPQARKPAYQLHLDFGGLGTRKSSAQITDQYTPDELIGKQVLAVVNFPPKQIANFFSECLVLGVVGDPGGVVLIEPNISVPNGLSLG